jgi:Zn-finger nucleic acid-binding protein
MMQCPICQKPLVATRLQKCFVCPGGHGALLPSSQLIKKSTEIASHVEPAETTGTAAAPRNHDITCPNCRSMMQRVDYSSTGIIIDSCLQCHSRWLDRGELTKIVLYKPQLNKADADFLEQLEEQMSANQAPQPEDVNPTYRLATGPSFGSLWAVGFAVSRAVMKGLLHSKYTRIATVLILFIVLLLYVYVIKEFQS